MYTGAAIEAFANDQDEVALYDGAPASGTVVDFVAYGFLDAYLPGAAHDFAVAAGIWLEGDFFPGAAELDEGDSIGRATRIGSS